MTEIGLLAQGRNVIWVQDAAELDEGDWSLFESLKRDSTLSMKDGISLVLLTYKS